MLRKREFLRAVVLVVAMVVVFAVAYFAEMWLRQLRVVANAEFKFAPYYWATGLSNLALAVILVSLLWAVLRSGSVHLAVFAVYFVAGGIVVMDPVLRIYGVRILPSEAVLTFPHGLLVTAGAFFAGTGLIGLVLSIWQR
ncbi:MAG: hypothetical protein R3248_03990 [Candidatus Promineifilaceae bacterium]|nr:hypothetical protein [Candidatus Promineifilaceae bacterium]